MSWLPFAGTRTTSLSTARPVRRSHPPSPTTAASSLASPGSMRPTAASASISSTSRACRPPRVPPPLSPMACMRARARRRPPPMCKSTPVAALATAWCGRKPPLASRRLCASVTSAPPAPSVPKSPSPLRWASGSTMPPWPAIAWMIRRDDRTSTAIAWCGSNRIRDPIRSATSSFSASPSRSIATRIQRTRPPRRVLTAVPLPTPPMGTSTPKLRSLPRAATLRWRRRPMAQPSSPGSMPRTISTCAP